MNKVVKNVKDDEFDDLASAYLLPNIRTMQVRHVSISIDEEVKSPKYYRAIAEELQSLNSNDYVQFRINSPGGSLWGLITLLQAIEQTDANVLAIIEGECHSAASILALNCPNVMVSPFASMMIHNVSYGTFGKDADIVAHVSSISEYSKRLVNETYKGFLSDAEIEAVLNGKEIWLQADEIEQRLEARSKYFEKLSKPKKPRKTKVESEVIPDD